MEARACNSHPLVTAVLSAFVECKWLILLSDHITRHSRTHGDRNASEHLGGGMQKSSKLPTTTSNAAKLACEA